MLFFLLVFGVVITRCAWLCDDAYITFRTVDNLVNGYGLTWNVGERVQVYTHPLWMMLLSAVYLFTREAFFSSQVLSIAISLLAVTVLATRVAASRAAAWLGVAILAASKAFVDYSTSGLENPLTHLILVAFFLVYLRSEASPKTLFLLALLAALGMLTRLDTGLLFLPPLVAAWVRLRQAKGLIVVAAGFVPLILWEALSFFYYGALLPNTALAKLNFGLIGRRELLEQGLHYLSDSIEVDPLTLVVIGAGLALPLVRKAWRALPIAAGMVLYLCYVIRIGGDFMSGRFLTAPLLAAVVILVGDALRLRREIYLASFVPLIVLVLRAPYSPLLTSPEHSADVPPERWINPYGIADERAYYYPHTGLLLAFERTGLPDHEWAMAGRAARLKGPAIVQDMAIGFLGYFAGPRVHVVDQLGLADPLLARLPPADPDWRVGHLLRVVPAGYIETLASGENRIADENVAAYYDVLAHVTRGDLFDVDRLVEAWKLNMGAYDHYLDAYAYFRGQAFTQRLLVTNSTDNPCVAVYVANGETSEAILLDDTSQRGEVYTVQWTIAADGVRFEGPHVRHLSSIHTLSDGELLNVGVYFSRGPDAPSRATFERRFWFRIEEGRRLLVVLPGMEWRNLYGRQDTWFPADTDSVMVDIYP
jgi:arabinofuranosyltransferase